MDSKSQGTCGRCDRVLQTHTFLVDYPAPYCRHCRVTYWKRSLMAAILAALAATAMTTFLSWLEADVKGVHFWLGVGATGWLVCMPLLFISGRRGGQLFAIASLLYVAAIPIVAAESDGSPLEVIAVVGCMVSIFLTLVVYRLTHRNECRACGHRAAMKKTGAHRHVKEDFLLRAHDDALWRTPPICLAAGSRSNTRGPRCSIAAPVAH